MFSIAYGANNSKYYPKETTIESAFLSWKFSWKTVYKICVKACLCYGAIVVMVMENPESVNPDILFSMVGSRICKRHYGKPLIRNKIIYEIKVFKYKEYFI